MPPLKRRIGSWAMSATRYDIPVRLILPASAGLQDRLLDLAEQRAIDLAVLLELHPLRVRQESGPGSLPCRLGLELQQVPKLFRSIQRLRGHLECEPVLLEQGQGLHKPLEHGGLFAFIRGVLTQFVNHQVLLWTADTLAVELHSTKQQILMPAISREDDHIIK